jgi:hypothetical protein
LDNLGTKPEIGQGGSEIGGGGGGNVGGKNTNKKKKKILNIYINLKIKNNHK